MEAGGRIFPRIKTNVGRANQGFEGSNPYVANPPNRNYLPEKDYDYDDDVSDLCMVMRVVYLDSRNGDKVPKTETKVLTSAPALVH